MSDIINNKPQHILTNEGILTTFNIAKKITGIDVKKLREKLNKCSNIEKSKKLESLLKSSILKETQKAMETQKIPGLIIEKVKNVEEKKKLIDLTNFCAIVSKKIMDKKIEKYYRCFIINTLVNMLELSEDDFEEFHRKFSDFKDKDEGDNDE